MSKKTCFWCDNIVEKDGELCLSCRERKIKGDEELEQIDKEYNKLFGHLDCKGMIKLYKERSKTISDLEAKLAGSEEKIKELEEKIVFEKSNAFELGERAIMSTLKENNQLKQQLAEKEKELDLEKFFFDLVNNPKGQQTIKKINQDKISFCVEQLEKVKTLCKENFDWWKNNGFTDTIYDKLDVSNAYFHIEAIIEEQIKQLREGE